MFILSLEVIDGFALGILTQSLMIVGRGEETLRRLTGNILLSGYIVLFGFLIIHVHVRLSFSEFGITIFFCFHEHLPDQDMY